MTVPVEEAGATHTDAGIVEEQDTHMKVLAFRGRSVFGSGFVIDLPLSGFYLPAMGKNDVRSR